MQLCLEIRTLSNPLVVPLLVPEKTSVNDLPSFETPITNLLILSVPLYHETSRLHIVFFFPISNVRDDPRPCSDHRVARSSSIAYFGPRLGVPPASVIFETDSLLQGLEVGGDGGGGVLPTEVANDHVLPAVIALPALSFTPVVMVTVYEVENPSDEEGLKVTVFASVLNANVPAILVPAPLFTVNIVGLDQLCTGSLNVAVIEEVTATPVAPLSGLVIMTDGGVVSEFGSCVIKLPSTFISEMLAQSLIEFPFTVIFTYRPVVSGKS